MIKHGARPIKFDRRDYSFHKTFGSIAFDASTLPDNYNVDAGLWVPNQGIAQSFPGFDIPALPFGCTDYVQTELCVDEDGKLYNPMDLENITHFNASGGGDIRVALKAAIQAFKRTAYFSVRPEGILDYFDAVRIAMFVTASEKRAVSVGTPWFPDWQPPGYGNGALPSTAIVPMPKFLYTNNNPWHNWKICGWKSFNGVPYLIGKSLQGDGYGDKGFHYVPRDVFNAVMALSGTCAFTISKVAANNILTIDWSVLELIKSFLSSIFSQFSRQPMTPAPIPTPAVQQPAPAPKYLWDNPANVKHSVRVICDEEGLTVAQKNDLDATVHCESGYNPKCVHPNIVNGKAASTDYGICQINDFYHIGPGKDFPSVDYVINNPEACIRWMCKQWKAGNAHLWVCYSKGLYLQYRK